MAKQIKKVVLAYSGGLDTSTTMAVRLSLPVLMSDRAMS